MVVDTSAILAVLFGEPAGHWAAEQLNDNRGDLRKSTVNLAEALIRIQDRQPARAAELCDMVMNAGVDFEAPDARQARIAATARMQYPLNLGDCFAYALAIVTEDAILTLDKDFQSTDCRTVMPE